VRVLAGLFVVAFVGCYDLDRLRSARDQPDVGAVPDSGAGLDADASPPDPCASARTLPAATEDLVAYYPLDEVSGTVAHDCSGRGFHGTVLVSAPAWTTGHVGGGLRTSASACVDLASATAAKAFDSDNITLAAWVQVTSFPPYPSAGYVVGKTLDPDRGGWRLGSGSGQGSANGAVALPGNSRLSVSAPMSGGVFTHVALVITSGGSMDLYLDGVLRNTIGGVPTPLVPSPAVARIGCRGDGTEAFDGIIDEVRIYGRALGANEIAGLAHL